MKTRLFCLALTCLFAWCSYAMLHEPLVRQHAFGGVCCVLTFVFFCGVVGPNSRPNQDVYISVEEIDPTYSRARDYPHVFGEAGRWTPLYSPERAITDLTDDHLVNATLWIDRKLTQAASRKPSDYDCMQSEWDWMQYLVGKSDELKAECLRRGISVPVGKEPPPPEQYKPKEAA